MQPAGAFSKFFQVFSDISVWKAHRVFSLFSFSHDSNQNEWWQSNGRSFGALFGLFWSADGSSLASKKDGRKLISSWVSWVWCELCKCRITIANLRWAGRQAAVQIFWNRSILGLGRWVVQVVLHCDYRKFACMPAGVIFAILRQIPLSCISILTHAWIRVLDNFLDCLQSSIGKFGIRTFLKSVFILFVFPCSVFQQEFTLN